MYKFVILLLVALTSRSVMTHNFPSPVSIDSRIKVLVYNPNEIFTVVFSQGYYSYIEFADGEKVKNIAIGDASSWKISHNDNKLFVMPYEQDSYTNMIVTTSKKRSYIFDLVSRSNYNKQISTRELVSKGGSNADSDKKDAGNNILPAHDIAYVVRFYYPSSEDEFDLDIGEISTPSQMHYTTDEPEEIIQGNDTKYNYVYIDKEGVDNFLIPLEIFDDGRLTYFKFKGTNIPKIFIEIDDKTKIMCKRLSLGDYVIIKGVHKKLFMYYNDTQIEIINKAL